MYFAVNGDLKFILLFLLLFGLSIYRSVRQYRSVETSKTPYFTQSFGLDHWLLVSSILSLLLGFMHSFYFISQAGGISPQIIYQGVSNALITPVFGLGLLLLAKMIDLLLRKLMIRS
jgi:hypothetical protein